MWIAGREISELPDKKLSKVRLSRIGFVFQSYNLLSVLTAEPPKLSGEQQQRVAVARAGRLIRLVDGRVEG